MNSFDSHIHFQLLNSFISSYEIYSILLGAGVVYEKGPLRNEICIFISTLFTQKSHTKPKSF